MINVYIAAPYQYRLKAALIGSLLERNGIHVTSRWLQGEDGPLDKWAVYDLEDVDACDILLALNPEGWENKGSGGRWVEFGYAYAKMKSIILAGEPSTIFAHLPRVKVIDDTEDLVKQVRKVYDEYYTKNKVVDIRDTIVGISGTDKHR